VSVTGWWVREETVLHRLARTRGLAYAPLEPSSEAIQLVTYDGEHLGHVRLDGPHSPQARWVAVPRHQGPPLGTYTSARAAARALARAAGQTITPNGGAT
jgi:hypothetical protein